MADLRDKNLQKALNELSNLERAIAVINSQSAPGDVRMPSGNGSDPVVYETLKPLDWDEHTAKSLVDHLSSSGASAVAACNEAIEDLAKGLKSAEAGWRGDAAGAFENRFGSVLANCKAAMAGIAATAHSMTNSAVSVSALGENVALDMSGASTTSLSMRPLDDTPSALPAGSGAVELMDTLITGDVANAAQQISDITAGACAAILSNPAKLNPADVNTVDQGFAELKKIVAEKIREIGEVIAGNFPTRASAGFARM
jgi:uncharacterized protein YukE